MSDTSKTASRQQPAGEGGGATPPVPRSPLVGNLNDAGREFRRPFAAPAVKWKVQTELANKRGLMVAYIDARLVYERLDVVVGAGNWHSHLEEFAGGIKCSLTVFGVTKEDVGKGGFEKASASDAVKRAAVPWGIGRSLYAVPVRTLRSTDKGELTDDGHPTLKRVAGKGGKTHLYITDACERYLREKYAEWLLTPEGEDRYGEVLDHGSAIGTIGDMADAGVYQDAAPDDDNALEARKTEIRERYEQAVKDGAVRSTFPKPRFDARMRSDLTDKDLDELEAEIVKFEASGKEKERP